MADWRQAVTQGMSTALETREKGMIGDRLKGALDTVLRGQYNTAKESRDFNRDMTKQAAKSLYEEYPSQIPGAQGLGPSKTQQYIDLYNKGYENKAGSKEERLEAAGRELMASKIGGVDLNVIDLSDWQSDRGLGHWAKKAPKGIIERGKQIGSLVDLLGIILDAKDLEAQYGTEHTRQLFDEINRQIYYKLTPDQKSLVLRYMNPGKKTEDDTKS